MTTESWNARRWSDDDRGRYEVWYLTWNDASDRGYWLRYVVESPLAEPAYAEVWFARFDPRDPKRTFAFHRRFDRVAATPSPFEIAIGDAVLRHDGARGEVSGAGHAVRWDLRWQPAERELRVYPDLAYSARIGPTTMLMPNPRVLASGTLEIDGERVALDGVPVGQSHLWGKKHAYSWTWAHCVDFDDAPGSHLELVAARLHRRGVTLPALVMVTLDLDGEHLRLNQFRHLATNRGEWRDQRVTFRARGARVQVEGELSCTPDRMVVAPYVDPDGTEVFCSNTEIGDARVVVSRRRGLGWRVERTLVSTRRAHFEIGGRTRDAVVTGEHVLV
jgi:hypothetical protein